LYDYVLTNRFISAHLKSSRRATSSYGGSSRRESEA